MSDSGRQAFQRNHECWLCLDCKTKWQGVNAPSECPSCHSHLTASYDCTENDPCPRCGDKLPNHLPDDCPYERGYLRGQQELLAEVRKLPSPWKREAWQMGHPHGPKGEYTEVRHKCEWCGTTHEHQITQAQWDCGRYPDNVPHPSSETCLWFKAHASAAGEAPQTESGADDAR